MSNFEENILKFFETIHPLDQVKRAGYILRGVPEPESVAAHSHFLAVLTLLMCDEYPEDFNKEKGLAIALTHDLCEAQLMDIPMPVADAHLKDAKDEAEQAITEKLFEGFDAKYGLYQAEFLEASTPEAKLVRGLDKAQMMLKISMYQQEGKGRLKEFWLNPKNFNDFGLEQVSKLFDAICVAAGKPRPR
ncbi:MAG TPA: HD domain-containing protein [Candidatus Hydrogenedentes bacterium]|nr:HD domain-containing protein [Candidatus Hydrogenedentota bacterium]